MNSRQIDDAVDKIFDLLNDGAKDDPDARKFLADLLTDVYNAGYNEACLSGLDTQELHHDRTR